MMRSYAWSACSHATANAQWAIHWLNLGSHRGVGYLPSAERFRVDPRAAGDKPGDLDVEHDTDGGAGEVNP